MSFGRARSTWSAPATSSTPAFNRYDPHSRSSPSRLGTGQEPHVRTLARRRACRRSAPDSRPHGRAVQHASRRRRLENEWLLQPRLANARTRHRPGRASPTSSGKTGSPRSGSAFVASAKRIGPDKPLILVGYSNGGALALKYALDQVESGDGLRAARLVADLADDRRRAVRVDVAGHQPARSDPVFREGAMARRDARVQPVQVQLLSRERRLTVVAIDDGVAGPDSASGQSRPPQRPAAGAGVSVAG